MTDGRAIEVYAHSGEGYEALLDFESWRIGYMRHAAQYLAQNIERFQRHEGCDEAFVLLKGRCCLLTGGYGETVGDIEGTEMEPFRVYNIKKGVWHSHLVDEDTDVLVVENSNVTLENSPLRELDAGRRKQILQIEKARRTGRRTK